MADDLKKESSSSKATDVFVIGGGPAGIAAALAVRQRGLKVVVADGCSAPIDKPCGEGLMPDGIVALQRLGVHVPFSEGYAFRGIRFVSSGMAAQAEFPSGVGLGVRRTNLHRVLVEHAERVGVQFLWRAVVTGLDCDGVSVDGKDISARWIVGADGSGSRVRKWAGLDAHRVKEQRFAFRRHYRIAPWSEFMELHWGERCQIYVTPVAADEICVVAISRDPDLRLDEALCEFPEFAARLQGADCSSRERGAESVTRKLVRVCNDQVALIGDASGGVDAITGEGLSLAFHQAQLLGDCVAQGSLGRYEAGYRALARRPAIMSRLMLTFEHREKFRRRAMRVFTAKPHLFTRMLAAHVGAASPARMAASGLHLGWNLLTV